MIELAFLLFSLGVATAFLIGSLLLMQLGRRMGARHISARGESAMRGLSAAEGAVFALMGLVLAFAISGALQRYDDRKVLILQEANAIATAHDRADLLKGEAVQKLKEQLKRYLQLRIEFYKLPIEFSLQQGGAIYSAEHLDKIAQKKADIWKFAVASCEAQTTTMPCTLLLPAINAVTETARLRSGANERHPPQIIYVMLFGLGLGGSLLAGFGMAAGYRSRVHMMIFAGALAFALFIVTDLEFPRLGIFRISHFDHFLTDLLARM
jgi:hypothetical protein